MVLQITLAAFFGMFSVELRNTVNIAFATLLLLTLILILFRELQSGLKRHRKELNKELNIVYRQIEAYQALNSLVKFSFPPVGTRGWAASPDFLYEIAKNILSAKPQVILEASSGLSTIVAASCLRQIGGGKVISLEHDEKYAENTQKLIKESGLQDYAEIVYAPLTPSNINDEIWLWYDYKRMQLDASVDMFIVDGPPRRTQKLARYPALPLMFADIRNNGLVLLDDGNRDDERIIATRWAKEYSCNLRYLDLEKGAFALQITK